MKQKYFFIIFICLSILPNSVYAEETCDFDNILISLRFVDKPLSSIFSEIEKQSQYSISYNDFDLLNKNSSILLEEIPLSLALKRLLKNQNYVVTCDGAHRKLNLLVLDTKNTDRQQRVASSSHSSNDRVNVIDRAFSDFLSSAGEDGDNVENNSPPPKKEANESDPYYGLGLAWNEEKENNSTTFQPPPKKEPNESDIYYSLGREWNAQGNVETGAVKPVEKTAPDESDPYYELGKVWDEEKSNNSTASQSPPKRPPTNRIFIMDWGKPGSRAKLIDKYGENSILFDR